MQLVSLTRERRPRMKSTLVVFFILTMKALGNSDSTYFMVHEQTGLAECENNLSSSLESSPQGELQPKNKAGAATQSLSINLDGKQALRFAQIEHEGANNLDSERIEYIVNLDGELTRNRRSTAGEIAINATARQPAPQAPLVWLDKWKRILPIQTPSIVEAFYSRNQQMLQDWKVGYDNSLFVRLDQPGFISPYFSILRARNLIVP